MATANFVKFRRGTSEQFAKITSPDFDTLYFISDDDKTGSLYLGSKLISGGSSVTLDALEDILIENAIDGQLIVYDEESDKWVNKSVADVLASADFKGASENEDGVHGLVPAPKAGDLNSFLRSDGQWSPITGAEIKYDPNVFQVNDNSELTFKGIDEVEVESLVLIDKNKNLTYVPKSTFYTKEEVDAIVTSKLTRTIVDSVSDIDLTAEDAGDYIYMVKAADGSEGNIYTEYMVVNGSLELIGSTATDLQGYVTSSLYESEVGDLSKLGKENTTIVDEILSIEERLTWQPIEEDN